MYKSRGRGRGRNPVLVRRGLNGRLGELLGHEQIRYFKRRQSQFLDSHINVVIPWQKYNFFFVTGSDIRIQLGDVAVIVTSWSRNINMRSRASRPKIKDEKKKQTPLTSEKNFEGLGRVNVLI